MATRKGSGSAAPETPGWVEGVVGQIVGYATGSGSTGGMGTSSGYATPPAQSSGIPSWLPWALIGAAAVWFLFLRKGR
jgi:hypothetical protein